MAFDADALIDKFGETDDTFRIPTSDNPEEDVICKTISDVRGMTEINQLAGKLERSWEKGTVPETWKPYGPITREIATIAAELQLLVVEPKFTTLQALKLCKQAGVFAAFLHSAIMQRLQQDIPVREMDAVDDEKNGSRPIVSASSNGHTSPSGTSTSESIPTTSRKKTGDTLAST